MQNVSASPVMTGAIVLGLLLLMSLAGGVLRGLVVALLMRRLFQFVLPLSLGAGLVFGLAHLFG